MQGEINLIRFLLTFIGTADQSVKHAHFGKRKILFLILVQKRKIHSWIGKETQNPGLDFGILIEIFWNKSVLKRVRKQVQWNPALQPPRYYGHFFWPPGKTAIHFLEKKKKNPH